MTRHTAHAWLLLLALTLALPAHAADRDGDGIPDSRDPHPSIAGPAPWVRLERIELSGAGVVALAPRVTDERPDWPCGRDARTRALFEAPREVVAASGGRELGWPSRARGWGAGFGAEEHAAAVAGATTLRLALRLANPLPLAQRWELRAIRLLAGERTIATLPGGRWLLRPRSQLVARVQAPLTADGRAALLALRSWPALALDGQAPSARAVRIEARTAPLRLAIPGRELGWRVARTVPDGQGGVRPITAGEALAALDALLRSEERPLLVQRGGSLRALAGRANQVDGRWWRVRLGGVRAPADWRERPLGEAGLALRYLRRHRGEGVALDGRRFRRAAEAGDAWAATVYGVCLHNGYGVDRDREASLRWFRAAAARHAGAQLRLGRAYLRGQGVARDDAQAGVWFGRAAEQGHPAAQRYLGLTLLRAGKNAEAARWYRQAAAAGEVEAQHELGILLLQGRGVERDEAGALRWFRAAAQEGLTRARSSWGWCLVNGRGTAKDRPFGLALLRRSAAQGCGYARRVLRAQGE